MSHQAATIAHQPTRLSADFRKFRAGQTISHLGSSITRFALPLLIFKRMKDEG